jgi:hypothetical protein
MGGRAILLSTFVICAVAPIAQITFHAAKRVEIDVKRPNRKPATKRPFVFFTIGTFSVLAASAWAWRKDARKSLRLLAGSLVLGGIGVFIFGSSWYDSLRRPVRPQWQDISDFIVFVQFLAALLFVAGLKIFVRRGSGNPATDLSGG